MAGRIAFLFCLKFLKLSSFNHKTSKYRKRQTSEIGFVSNLRALINQHSLIMALAKIAYFVCFAIKKIPEIVTNEYNIFY